MTRRLRTGWRRLKGFKGEVWLAVRIVYGDGKPYILAARHNGECWLAELKENENVSRFV